MLDNAQHKPVSVGRLRHPPAAPSAQESLGVVVTLLRCSPACGRSGAHLP